MPQTTEDARIKIRLKRLAGEIKASGMSWQKMKSLKPCKAPKAGAKVEIVECPTCHVRVGSYDRAKYDVTDEGGWVAHAHQPVTVHAVAYGKTTGA